MSDQATIRILPNFLNKGGNGRSRNEKLKTIEQEIGEFVAEQRAAAPKDFAPLGDPERMQQVAKLAGQTIRDAYGVTARKVEDASADVVRMVAAIKADGDEFVEKLKQMGEEHATKVETALSHLHGLLVRFNDERRQLNVAADQISHPEEESHEQQ